jgi:acyl-CoA synthetase (AMP-forming)/AMP-acid ligase II
MALVPLVGGLAMVGAYLDAKYSIRSDLAQIRAGKNGLKYWQQLCAEYGEDDWSYYHLIHKTYGKNEYDEALLFEDRSWTYSQFRMEIGRLAIAFQKMGITNRTVVGMYINNSPEFMFSWWALYKIGAIPCPLNTSITEEPFRHCLRVSDSKFLITTYELFDAANRSLSGQHDIGVFEKIGLYDYDTYPSKHLPDTVTLLSQQNLDPLHPSMADWPKESRPKVGPEDTSQYLFTSGTTGLPKALIWPVGHANMGGSRYRWPMMFEKPRRTYICTPMFHGGATFALLPSTFAMGGTIILVRKFSRKNFWNDMRRTQANMMFYIGEMIRYLVQAPPDPHHPDETKGHSLEVIFGLGLTAPVWKQFRDRFGVKWIAEYYGASEGTTAISNSNFSNERGVAKVAHWGPLMRSKWFGQKTTYIIRIDMDTMEVIRNPKTGKCIQCEYGEVGEAIMRIVPPLQRSHDYVGEKGKKATQEKLITNVFEEGDLFWRMGDALSMVSTIPCPLPHPPPLLTPPGQRRIHPIPRPPRRHLPRQRPQHLDRRSRSLIHPPSHHRSRKRVCHPHESIRV